MKPHHINIENAFNNPYFINNIKSKIRIFGTESDNILSTFYTKVDLSTSLPLQNRFSDQLNAQILSKVGLFNYSCIPLTLISKRLSIFTELIKNIENLHNLSTILEFTRFICWIKPSNKDYTPIASTTFYNLPYITFITDAALKSIAPDIVFPNNYPYALFDNLLHESLHQELITFLLTNKIFKDGYSQSEYKIYIPWRKIYWSFEHSLQAAYVYINLIKTRKLQLENESNEAEAILLKSSLKKAISSSNHLVAGLLEYLDTLNYQGIELVNWMKQELR